MIKPLDSDTLYRSRVSDGMSDPASRHSSVVAAQLVEAACRVREGDDEAAKAHIARAVALLHGQPISIPGALQALRAMARQTPRGGLAAWQVRRVAAHVDANLGGKIHVTDFAALLGLSSSHFSHAFTRTFGISAHAWLTRRRVEAAQALMLTTEAPLSEIAQSCGMTDQSHLTRLFRRVVGETPCFWRRSRRGAMEEKVTQLPRAHSDQSKVSETERAKAGNNRALEFARGGA